MKVLIFFIAMVLFGAGCGMVEQVSSPSPQSSPTKVEEPVENIPQGGREIVERIDFSQFNPIFRFSAALPRTWQVEYVPEIEALNIYGPAQAAIAARELSQIFIRHFEANDFLTLRTVDVLDRKNIQINGHDAVEYEIAKRPGVPDFPHQPSFRNGRHKVTDVRFTENSPSVFYVFARNPSLPDVEFVKFIASLQFHNDLQSVRTPIDRVKERITEKPFGLKVAPGNSPVDPERFSGYHTGVDFEIFDHEQNQDMGVRAFCGGPLREKRTADGYGGVMVQECMLGDQAITVVYGHLDIASVQGKVGEYISPGHEIGLLGSALSKETDGERKHLHFGIHKGTRIELRGYVARESDLDQWHDPWQYVATL